MAWAPDYVTSSELAAHCGVGDMDDDVSMALAVTTASRAVDDHCNRQFGLLDEPAERIYTARPDIDRGVWVVDIDDLMTTTGLVATVGVTLTPGATLEPVNAAADGRPWTRLVFGTASETRPTGVRDEVSVVARWGWTAVPVPVKQATLLQATRLFKRRDSPMGVAGSPELGNELRLLARVDPDVGVSLRGLVRPRGVA